MLNGRRGSRVPPGCQRPGSPHPYAEGRKATEERLPAVDGWGELGNWKTGRLRSKVRSNTGYSCQNGHFFGNSGAVYVPLCPYMELSPDKPVNTGLAVASPCFTICFCRGPTRRTYRPVGSFWLRLLAVLGPSGRVLFPCLGLYQVTGLRLVAGLSGLLLALQPP